jgi:hypothetical protein
MPISDSADILKILQAVAEADRHGAVWWRTDGEWAPVTFFVNCNDVFAWGCADAEDLTPENCDEFVKACNQALEYGPELFVARVRGMRPQGAFYEGMTESLAAAFNACGPEREVGPGNPFINSIERRRHSPTELPTEGERP